MLEQQPKESVALGLHPALIEDNSITPVHNFEEKTGLMENKLSTVTSIGILQPTSMRAEFDHKEYILIRVKVSDINQKTGEPEQIFISYIPEAVQS